MEEKDFDYALKAELEPGEQIVWRARPNTDAMRGSILSVTVLWLCGLFMMGAGLMRNAADDSQVLPGMIGLLLLVAIAGILEMIIIPKRSGRTMYILTNMRIFSLCVTRRLVHQEDADYQHKEIVRVTRSSVASFYASNIPAQLMFVILAWDIIGSLMRSFDTFITVGFALTLLGWMQPWLQDMRMPLPKFRDAQRTFYNIGDMFVFLESFSLSEIAEFIYRKGRGQTFNAFVISKSRGCIRMKAIPEIETVKSALAELPKS
ncbi:MAG TPA: hypothetical protein V6C76_00230 [Drouetiella sp.]